MKFAEKKDTPTIKVHKQGHSPKYVEIEEHPKISLTQNRKIHQVTEATMVIGVDIVSEIHWARSFDWRGLELVKTISFENSARGFQQFTRWASELAASEHKDRVIGG